MFGQLSAPAPHVPPPYCRCWTCYDSGWVVSSRTEYQTTWTLCSCRIVTVSVVQTFSRCAA